MLQRMVDGVIGALFGAIKVVVLFGVLVGLVVWAKADPESWQRVMASVAGAAMLMVTKLAELITSLLNGAG
jgi:uncharacterized membrane protein